MKVEAKELRYGNILNRIFDSPKSNADKESICIGSVNGLHNTYCCFEDSIGSLEELEPIKLSSLWLIDFGYEDWGIVVENEYEKYQRFVLHNFVDGTSNHEVHIIESNYGGQKHIEYATSIDKDERQYNGRMEFVHDLQNAVYKETGIELVLNT